MGVKLSDLEVFLESCEQPTTLVNEEEGYRVLLDYTPLKTRAGRPRLVFRLHDAKRFLERILERGGIFKNAKMIVDEAYEQECPDLDVYVKVPDRYSVKIMREAFNWVSSHYNPNEIFHDKSSAGGGAVILLASSYMVKTAVDLACWPIAVVGICLFGFGVDSLYNYFSFESRKKRAEIARRVNVSTF
jgi:hypothetical protein